MWREGAIVRAELTSIEQGNAHGGQKAVAHRPQPRSYRLHLRERAPRGHERAPSDLFADQESMSRKTTRLHARNSAESTQQRVDRVLFARNAVPIGEEQVDREHVRGVVA